MLLSLPFSGKQETPISLTLIVEFTCFNLVAFKVTCYPSYLQVPHSQQQFKTSKHFNLKAGLFLLVR